MEISPASTDFGGFTADLRVLVPLISVQNDMLSDGFSRETKSRITQCLGLCISEGQPLMRGAYTGTPKRWSSVFSEPMSPLGCLYPVSY